MSDASTSSSPRDARFEAKFLEWSLEFHYEPTFPVDGIAVAEWAQVRQPEHIAAEDAVEEYRQHMANGAAFPPVVLMAPSTLIDGNTRLKATERLRRKTIPAYIVSLPTVMMAKSLAAALNQMGGKRLTAEEAAEAAKTMMEMNFADEAIAREIGRSVEQVRRIRSQIEFGERTERLNLQRRADRVSQDNRVRLNSVKHDPPFAAMVELVGEFNPPYKTVTELLKKVNSAPSDKDAITVIADARSEMKPGGPPPRRITVSPEVQQTVLHLGGLIKLSANPMAILDLREDKREERIAQWQQLGDLARTMLDLYQSQVPVPAPAPEPERELVTV